MSNARNLAELALNVSSSGSLNGLANSAYTDTTNANNIVSGTLSSSVLPALPVGISSQIFTSSGTFTVPTGVTKVKVTLVGGGGGGCALGFNPGANPNFYSAATGGTGGTSSFGSYMTCTGGSQYIYATGTSYGGNYCNSGSTSFGSGVSGMAMNPLSSNFAPSSYPAYTVPGSVPLYVNISCSSVAIFPSNQLATSSSGSYAYGYGYGGFGGFNGGGLGNVSPGGPGGYGIGYVTGLTPGANVAVTVGSGGNSVSTYTAYSGAGSSGLCIVEW